MNLPRSQKQPANRNSARRLASSAGLAGLVVIALTIAAIFLQKHHAYYPEVVIQSTDTVQVGLLQHSYSSAAQCETAVLAVTQVMTNFCPECVVVRERCLENLSPRQRMLLAGQAVDVPVMRITHGVLTFEAKDLVVATQTCRDAARQAGGTAQCVTPDAARLALALGNASHTHMNDL